MVVPVVKNHNIINYYMIYYMISFPLTHQCKNMRGCFRRRMKKVSPSSGTLDSTNSDAQKPDTRSLVMKLKECKNESTKT